MPHRDFLTMRRLAYCFIGLSLDAYFSRDTEKRVIDLKLLQVQSTIALEKNYVSQEHKRPRSVREWRKTTMSAILQSSLCAFVPLIIETMSESHWPSNSCQVYFETYRLRVGTDSLTTQQYETPSLNTHLYYPLRPTLYRPSSLSHRRAQQYKRQRRRQPCNQHI